MAYSLFDFLTLLGSLGFFIYGMKVMSEGIQKVAGAKMRNILRSMTSNRVKGVLTGFTITSLVQSSSATTVLVVSFVNAGLLSLTESIGVIMGANIGTTITAWLISIVGFKVKISLYALPIIALGFPLMFFNREKLKYWGEVLVGFALLFMGLSFLKDAVPDIKSNPQILAFVADWSDLGFLSILIFVGIGTLITVVVQSSSAAMALTLVMANNGWIPFDCAAAMVLGENIGTTITANLAAIIANVHAKRAAFAHFIFNVFGVIWIVLLMGPFLYVINLYMVDSGQGSPFETAASIPIGLSIFHSAFNIVNTLLLIGFVGFIAKIVTRVIKSTGDDEYKLEFINTGLMNTAELSLEEARKETALFGEIPLKMSRHFRSLLLEGKSKKQNKLIKKIHELEENTDRLELEISEYLLKVSASGSISSGGTNRITSLLSINSDLERIGDIFYHMAKDIDRAGSAEVRFKSKQIKNLERMLDLVDGALEIMVANLQEDPSSIDMQAAREKEAEINSFRDVLRREQIKEIEKEKYEPKRDGWYKDLFHQCEKLGDYILAVSETLYNESGTKNSGREDK